MVALTAFVMPGAPGIWVLENICLRPVVKPLHEGVLFHEAYRLQSHRHQIDVPLGLRLRTVSLAPLESSNPPDPGDRGIEINIGIAEGDNFFGPHASKKSEAIVGPNSLVVPLPQVGQHSIAFHRR
nr:hypothetical protein [Collimonas pratensis]